MAIKQTNLFLCKPLKSYPNLDFWFENILPGNPDAASSLESDDGNF
jgi:hypothetical protein